MSCAYNYIWNHPFGESKHEFTLKSISTTNSLIPQFLNMSASEIYTLLEENEGISYCTNQSHCIIQGHNTTIILDNFEFDC